MGRRIGIVGLGIVGLALLYVLLLCFPQPLFAFKVVAGNLVLYCDEPIAEAATGKVLQDVQRRLETSPFYRDHPHQSAFVCNTSWRFRLLANRSSRAGGFAYAFAPWNVFLRRSDVASNVLFRPTGGSAGADRPLSYFIAHEITHNLTVRQLGMWAYLRAPVWKREGYADYVAKGGQFDFKANLALFATGDRTLDPAASGLYLRYHLLVAELLDRRKLTVLEMLRGEFDRAGLEADLRRRSGGS